MKNRLKRNERAVVRDKYAENPLWLMLQTPARKIEGEMKLFRLSAEELFMETFCILDDIKENPKDACLRMQGLWDEVFCDLRDLDTADAQEEELMLAATEVVYTVILSLSTLNNALFTKLTAILMCQLVEKDASSTERLQREYAINIIRMGEESLHTFMLDYMQSSDEWLSDKIEELLRKVPKEEATKTQEKEDNAVKTTQLTNRQLMILFDLFLNKGFSTEYCNQQALATLLSRVSGRSEGSIRQKIREGVDYDIEDVHKDVNLLARLLEPIDSSLAIKMKNLIE